MLVDKLQAFVDEELSRAPALLARVLDATLEELREAWMAPGRRVDETKGRLIEAVVADRATFDDTFMAALRDKVKPGPGAEPAGRATLDFASSQLMLIDDSQVEDGIVVARAFELVEQRAEWELRELQSLTSALSGGKVSKDSNPFTPQAYAHALGTAVKVLRVPTSDQHELIQACVSALSRELKLSYADAAKRLRAAGVKPASYQATQLAQPQSAPSGPSSPPAQGRAPAGGGGTFAPGGGYPAGAGYAPAAGYAPGGGGYVAGGAPFAPGGGMVFVGAGTGAGLAQAMGAGSRAAAADAEADAAGHVADLFAAMQRDHDVPLPARSALAGLARVAADLAQRDAALLADQKHPFWQLLNRFGEASSLYPNDADPRLDALVEFLQTQALDGLSSAGADSVTCIKLLSGLEQVINDLRQQQLAMAQEAMARLEQAERETAGIQRAARLVDARLTGLAVPGVVRLFLKGQWSRVIAKLIDTRGVQSGVVRQAQDAIDELLETLTPLQSSAERSDRIRKITSLRMQLKAGLGLIDGESLEADRFLSKLNDLQTLVLTAKRDSPEVADVAVRPMTADELRAEASRPDDVVPSSHGLSDMASLPVIDAHGLATVRADLMPDPPQGDARRLSQMTTGDTCRLLVAGDFQPMQVLWISPQQRFWLFAGPEPGTVAALARLALDRLDAAGLVQPIHRMSLLDRCLARISGVVDTHF